MFPLGYIYNTRRSHEKKYTTQNPKYWYLCFFYQPINFTQDQVNNFWKRSKVRQQYQIVHSNITVLKEHIIWS
jgi:hypothetical protein